MKKEAEQQHETEQSVPWASLARGEPGGVENVVSAIRMLNEPTPADPPPVPSLSYADVKDGNTLREFAAQQGVALPPRVLERMDNALATGTDPEELAHFVRGLAYQQTQERGPSVKPSPVDGAALSLTDVKGIDTLKQYAEQLGVSLPHSAYHKMEEDIANGQTPYRLACFVRGIAYEQGDAKANSVQETRGKYDKDVGLGM